MKHLKLLLALVVSLFGMNVNAQEASAVGEGQFFLFNVHDQAFLCSGSNWGTQATVDPIGVMYCTLSQNTNGEGYLIKTGNNGNENCFLGSDSYCDTKVSESWRYTAWAFTPVEVQGQANVYTIKAISSNNYIASNDGKTYKMTDVAPTDDQGYWKLFTRDQLLAQLDFSSASESNPIDVTFLVNSPNFLRQVDGQVANPGALSERVIGGWTVTTGGNNVSISVPNDGGSGQVNSGCEFWNNSYNIHQTVSVPNGKYIVTFDGFDTSGNGVIYGNDVETPFTSTESQTNALGTALVNVANGVYTVNKTAVITVGGGTITIGAKRSENYGGKWCVLDNCRLYYVGGVDLTDLINAYHAALEAAQNVNQSLPMTAEALAALQSAITNYSSVNETDADALTEASAALNEAVSAAEASIAGYQGVSAYLAKMGAVLDLTNVYTTDSYATWYSDVKTKYESNTLTDADLTKYAEVHAYGEGWHQNSAEGYIDNILLSTWAIGGTQCHKFDTNLYINNWSTEGNSDGSGMTTPFFEYWTDDNNSLLATTIQATVPGLNKDKSYKVTALVRVRQQNNNTKVNDGITFSVANGSPINAADGEQSASRSEMFYKTVEAYGTPDDEGNLTITFTVNGDSHISWLSFKNVMCEETEISQAMIDELYAQIEMPYDIRYNTNLSNTKAAVEADMTTEKYSAYQIVVNDILASMAEYATVKAALDEADAVYKGIKDNIPETEDALYGEIMDRAVPAYEGGLIESSPQIGSCAVALAYIEQGIRRLIIKQNVNGSVVDRGYPENNLSGTDVTTGNVNVAYDGLSPWMISESKAYTWHVNTWSDEGATDGSGMLTPFLEYWRGGGDRAGLDDVTISNTLAKQNLGRQDVTLYPNSVYEVSGQIRAYMEYTATGDIIGVKIFAGDFESDLSEQASTEVSNNKALIYGTFTVKGNTDANGNLTFGIKTKGTTANWIAAKNFSIKYISNNLDDLYKEAYLKALAKAQTDIAAADYANVGGAELDALQACIDNDPNVPGTVSYKNALESITEANDAFIAAKPAYDTFAAAASTEDPNLQYADPEKKNDWIDACSASPANAEDALAKAAEITTALRAYYESHALAEGVDGAVNVSDQIANYNATDGNEGWTWTGNKNAPRNAESWTDSQGNNAYMYFDGGNWGATSWTTTMEQTIPLPSGKYLLTAKGRASTNVTLTMSAGDASVNLPNIGASGNVFDRGWNDGSVEFESDGSTTIHVEATTEAQHEWFSIGDFRLVRLELYAVMADAEDYAALNAAIAAAEGNTLGFMDGEYAPYNNIAALQTLAEAKAIDQNADNTKEAITAMTASLNEAVWTANSGEVSAIDLTKCFDGSKDGSNRYYALGWGKNGGSDAYNTRIISGTEGNPGMAAVDNELALFTKFGTTYGTDLGYTMPLAANTLYKFTFKYGAFGENKEIVTNLALASEDGETTVSISPASFTRANNSGLANSDPEAWFDYVGYFKIEDAGNYVLTLTKNANTQQRQIVMGNISILSCEAIEIDENADYDNALAVSGVDVTLKRTITASGDKKSYNTLVLPFDLTAAQIKAAFGDDAQVYAYNGNEGTSVKFVKADEIQANVPVLLTTSTASSSAPYTFSNVEIEAATKAIAEGADIDFVGSYAAATSIDGKYFFSGNLIYKGTSDSKTMKGTRAYLEEKSGAGINALSLDIDGENITAIQDIDGTITPKAIYNLQGQKVTTPVKGGIYIIDGKKTLVK